ncbi:MAG: ATP-dependent zinc metalloprotease FtsH [Muribaculaceae bacterium]|nr:ATP-dependent zinc metalloprotease FtsH [Muribaculaceae bacterium]
MPPKNNPSGGPMKPFKMRFSIWWMYAIVFAVIFGIVYLDRNEVTKEVSFTEFCSYIEKDRGITKIIINTDGKTAQGQLTDSLARKVFNGSNFSEKPVATHAYVVTNISSADDLTRRIDQWRQNGDFTGSVDYEKSSPFGNILINFLPFVLLIGFWIWMMRRMSGGAGGPGGGGGVFSVGKSKAMLFDKDNADKVTFKDVAGLSEAKTEIEEIVQFLRKPDRYTALGGKIPKGALLVGPPGTGKTLLAKAVAGEANVPFFSMSGSDFVEMFVGVGASRVRDLFRQAKEKAPCIVFIDEIDAVGRARGRNAGMGGNDERENTLNQLLTEMDGFGSNSGVIILAATNRADILDKALMRAGRFDRQIYVDLPDLPDRVEIFKVHLRKVKTAPDLDVELLARQTPGFSGADIANVCNEAALIAARHDKDVVSKEDFSAAVDRIIGGLEKRSKITTAEEKKAIAIHEAGHATVSWHLRYANPLVKVTIVPRGKALGAAWYLPEERQITPSQVLLDEICATLGGRAAEEIFLGRISTGAANDLERVTKQAYAMVVYYGMSDRMPNLSYYDSTGQDMGFSKPYSNERAKVIDEEVSRIISEQYERAKAILREHAEGHGKLTDTLVTREVIFTEDVKNIFGPRPWASRTDELFGKNPEDPASQASEPTPPPIDVEATEVSDADKEPQDKDSSEK